MFNPVRSGTTPPLFASAKSAMVIPMCAKCSTAERSGKATCCAPSGAWFKNCEGTGDTQSSTHGPRASRLAWVSCVNGNHLICVLCVRDGVHCFGITNKHSLLVCLQLQLRPWVMWVQLALVLRLLQQAPPFHVQEIRLSSLLVRLSDWSNRAI